MSGATKLTPAMRIARREEQAFASGRAAAEDLVRALAVPDRAAQLAVAKVLIDARNQARRAIVAAKVAAAEQEAAADPENLGAALFAWYQGIGDNDQPNRALIVPPT